ncbi:colicin E3/pyocin S6 family cytotoxin [Cytobacillus gottheilii]|uniref:colicin E3/pyocin S6 family cytotoxin n=1 Tax=Cytobacillus gottheilii TaxID=859144 RepID=UPI003CF59637
MRPVPKPSILDNCEVVKIIGGRKLWLSEAGDRFYTWDSLHGEIEVFNKRGRHYGVLDPITGVQIKPPVKGRKIDV